MNVSLRTWSARFSRPFVISRGAWHERQGLWLFLEHGGTQAVGEAAPLEGFGTGSLAEVSEDLNTFARWARASSGPLGDEGPQSIAAWVDAIALPWTSSFSRAAIEGACAESAAATQGKTLAQWLHPRATTVVPVNSAPGGAQVGGVHKVKVGVLPWQEEVDALRERARRRPSERYRLDANGAWDLETALAVVHALEGLPIETLEEPLAEAHPEWMERLTRETAIPLAVDESLLEPVRRDELCTRACVQTWVLKPAALGGVVSGWRLAEQAASAGIRVTVTTLVDGCVGRWQAAELAAAVEGAGWGTGAHGLATGALLEDGVDDPVLEGGGWMLRQRPWGVEDLLSWSDPCEAP